MVCFEAVEEDILVFAKVLVPEEVQGSDGALGLLLVCLGNGFAGAAMSIIVSGEPKVMDPDPEGT